MRIQFEMGNEMEEDLNRLMEATGLTSKQDIFNNALSLFEHCAISLKQNPNAVIGVIDQKEFTYRAMKLPAFDNVIASKEMMGDFKEKRTKMDSKQILTFLKTIDLDIYFKLYIVLNVSSEGRCLESFTIERVKGSDVMSLLYHGIMLHRIKTVDIEIVD